MSASLLAVHTITDTARFEEYRTKVGPMIVRYGGRYQAAGRSSPCASNVRATWIC
jgi:uncharacterized protein (DUF1330 family)